MTLITENFFHLKPSHFSASLQSLGCALCLHPHFLDNQTYFLCAFGADNLKILALRKTGWICFQKGRCSDKKSAFECTDSNYPCFFFNISSVVSYRIITFPEIFNNPILILEWFYLQGHNLYSGYSWKQLNPRLSAPWRLLYFVRLINMYSSKITAGPTRDRGKLESTVS